MDDQRGRRLGGWTAALLFAGVSIAVGCRAADTDGITPSLSSSPSSPGCSRPPDWVWPSRCSPRAALVEVTLHGRE